MITPQPSMTPAEMINALAVPVCALSADSRDIGEGMAFLAYPGEADDGRHYIGDAVAAGAAGILWEKENFHWPAQWQVPNIGVEQLKDKSGALADVVYGAPGDRLPLVAITGTNGKTTTAFFVAQLLRNCGLIGTLGAGCWRRQADDAASPGLTPALSPLNNTTPDAITIRRWLKYFADEGMTAAVLEASSHGIAQGRLNGLRLAAAVMTNLAQDHLDYHRSMEAYWQAKAALFELPAQAAIVNADDPFCRRLLAHQSLPLLSYGQNGTDLRWRALPAGESGRLRLELDGVLGRRTIQLPFGGMHNVYNFAAAALTAYSLQLDGDAIEQAAAVLFLPPGRMQQVHVAPAIFIDYAHTPAALTAALTAARAAAGDGRVVAVLGAGGERDQGKRGDMGRVAAELADVVFVTDDNPRREDAAAIRAALCAQAPQARNIAGRAAAIAAALNEARAADTVMILGKGHECTQAVGNDIIRFSDSEAVRLWKEGRV